MTNDSILTESEYLVTLVKLEDVKSCIRLQNQQLEAKGLTTQQLERAAQPMQCFQAQLEEEIEIFENSRLT